MRQTPLEVGITYIGTTLLWVVLVVAIYLLAHKPGKIRVFWQKMLAQKGNALLIMLCYLVAGVIAARFDLGHLLGVLLGCLKYYCQALIGLAIAYSLQQFEPLPVTEAIRNRNHPWRAGILLLVIGLLAGIVGIILGALGQGILMSLFHETSHAEEAVKLVATDKLLAVFSVLGGGGIAEETTYRLVLLTLLWRLFGGGKELKRGRSLAIWLAALAFAVYHFTPLNSIYLVFWQYPVSQFTATLLIGLFWGYVYSRRGYETVVLSHTLADWLPVLIFA